MILLASLVACVTEDNFSDQLYSVVCQRYEECQKGEFDSTYDDQAECLDDSEDLADEMDDAFDSCDFTPDAATNCLADVRSADCDDFIAVRWGNDCDEVWDCD